MRRDDMWLDPPEPEDEELEERLEHLRDEAADRKRERLLDGDDV